MGAVLACAPLVGCVTHAPNVAVDGISVRSRTDDAMVVDVTLTLQNDNTGEVVLREFEYSVTGSSTFSGRRRADLTLAPLTTETMVIPAVLTGVPPGALPPDASLRVAGTVGWRGSGDLEKAFYDSGLYRPHATFGGSLAPVEGTPVSAGPPPAQTSTPQADLSGSDRRPR